MSFFSDIVGVATKLVETVAPIALGAIFPPAAMLGRCRIWPPACSAEG
jgi:hypothetical protein